MGGKVNCCGERAPSKYKDDDDSIQELEEENKYIKTECVELK